ncbi:response regulator [Thalassotalea sp. 1_MG-2023]|uniref:response regulator n=1 Tax=Thalassotalea sp. 1_MG-2023 TaxID=3062680 RepID=UPI0026E35A27|nr:response regulator [Thalassotalea sp. 1_MG-2023]MDO6426960.1 response regulator [Thalassotalea sp. 1_MG-2023]
MHQISSTDKHDKPMNIMIVEDNRINQMVLKGVLSNMNVNATTVNNGQEALNLLSTCVDKDQYDLIIMDCQMPILDGYQTTQAIRRGKAGKNNQNIIIIAMTASDLASDREKCLSAGMNDYATKPVDSDVLQMKLCYWLGARLQENEVSEQEVTSVSQYFEVNQDDTRENDIWDKAQFYRRIQHNEKLAKRLQSFFLEEAPLLIQEINKAVQENDMASVMVNIHKLKGMSVNLSANKLGKVARQIEAAIINKVDYNQMVILTQHLENVYQDLYNKVKNSNRV